MEALKNRNSDLPEENGAPLTILVLGGVPWREDINQSSVQMARAFARLGHGVIYAMRRRQSSLIRGVEGRRRIATSVAAPYRPPQGDGYVDVLELRGVNEVLPLGSPEPLRRLQMKIVLKKLERYMKNEGRQVDATVLYWWFFPELVPLLPGNVIYEAIDEHHAYAANRHRRRFNRRSMRLESETAKASAGVTCVSLALTERLSRSAPTVRHLPNGVDIALVQQVSEQCRVIGRSRPVIGYTGGLGDRMDWPALERMWRERANYDFVFVGGGTRPRTHPDNVSFLGPATYRDVVCHIKSFDVALIPFVDNDFTRGSDFLKTYDYLALGKPVVATRLPAIERLAVRFPSYITFVEDSGGWAAAIDAALQSSTRRTSDIPDLSAHTIEARARKLLSLIAQTPEYLPTGTAPR